MSTSPASRQGNSTGCPRFVPKVGTQIDEFLAGLEMPTPTWVNTNLTSSNGTVAASESPGALDTVDVFWNKTALPLEVYAVAGYRMA